MSGESIGICSTGIYEPKQVVNIVDVKLAEDISEGKIRKLGIESVRVASESEQPSTMAIEAAKDAIKNGGVDPRDIDIVIYTNGLIPDHLQWPDYAEIQKEIGAVNANSFRIYQGCNGQIVGLDYAYSKIVSDPNVNLVLIVAADMCCKPIINRWKATNTAFFGDGASAAIIKRGEKSNIVLGVSMTTDGTYNKIWQASTKGGTVLPFSNGVGLEEGEMLIDYVKSGGIYQTDDNMRKILVENIVAKNKQVIEEVTKCANTDFKINKVIVANMGINWAEQVSEIFNIPVEDTSYSVAKKHGHMGASDIFLNLHKMRQDGSIKSGDDVILFSGGAGYSVGCALIRYL